MSAKHPIVVITGSSGAGTTSVTRTFQHIFRREQINATIVEGDSFHRYDREQMRSAAADADKEGNRRFCHFSPEANTPWADVDPDSDLLYYEGSHGAAVTGKADVAQHADLLVGVVPIINPSGSRSCIATRPPAATPARTWLTRYCGGCLTT